MTFPITRRSFLGAAAACGATAWALPHRVWAQQPLRHLVASTRTIEVHGRAASVFALTEATSGKPGILLEPGERFAVELRNELGEPTIIHWHGQTPPPDLDGVTDTAYAEPVQPGLSATYDFAARPGTHWMHSHYGLQEQQLLAAPLIVRTHEDAKADMQEHTILLHDFTFRDPAEILSGLAVAGGHGAMGHGDSATGSMGPMGAMDSLDLNDVEYDAYLANDRTLEDPEVIRTEAGGRVRLRIINGATATSFWLDLGGATGTAVAVDGNPIEPVEDVRFPLAPGQRIDIVVSIPAGSAVPVLAQREGDTARTGVVLAAPGATVARIGPSPRKAPAVDDSLERRLLARQPLEARAAGRRFSVMLGGGMSPYVWTIDDRTWDERRPLVVRAGERIEIDMMNHSMMAHPMHLHGHHFQVTGINGSPLQQGAVRDTVLVPAMSRITIAFDAENPGRWLFHCHNLFHMAAGMMTEVVYES